MLVAFSFPEDLYQKIFPRVNKVLKGEGIWVEKEQRWPHISIASTRKDWTEEEQKEILAGLSGKHPVFIPEPELEIFEGRTDGTDDYLVLKTNVPSEYREVFNRLRKQYDIAIYPELRPHVSIIKFNKKDNKRIREILPRINRRIKNYMKPFTAKYHQIWTGTFPNFHVVMVGESIKRLKPIFYESLSDWSGDFVRYTDFVQPFISKKPWHQDPMGLYFFPKEFRTKGSWHLTNKYLVNAQLKSNAKVMDISTLSDKDMENIYDSLGISSRKWKEPTEYESKQEKFYRGIRDQYLGKQAKFSNDMRKIGYDAIFDDTGAVHNAEKQLIVFNPSAIKVTDVVPLAKGTDYIKKMEKIVKKEYADPEWPWKLIEEKWETRREYQQKIPILKLKYQVGDVIAEVGITYSQQPSEKAPGYYRTNIFTYPKDRGEETERIELEIRTDEPEQPELEHFQAKLREYIDKTMLKFKLQEPETEELDLGKLKSSFYEEQEAPASITKNPDKRGIVHLIKNSLSKAIRILMDKKNGDIWVWAEEEGPHYRVAPILGVDIDNAIRAQISAEHGAVRGAITSMSPKKEDIVAFVKAFPFLHSLIDMKGNVYFDKAVDDVAM